MSGPTDPAPTPHRLPDSVRATVHGGTDATAQILERLVAHGAKSTRYESRGEIARGGMGLILKVWDEDLRRELAMKVVLGEKGTALTSEIAPKTLGRFLEEAQVTGQLDHPGIVPVHELGLDENGAVFFTMQLVKGWDLKEIFELVHSGHKEWTTTRVLWVLLKVCDAMAYAHSKGVIHRDLKPANVMVGRFGEAYVMDWGLARVLGQPDRHDLRVRSSGTLSFVQSERRADASHSADSVLYTMDGDVVGTPAYMPPEQARGEIERLGPPSDVYALGAMLYHLLAGEMPYVTKGARVSQHMVLRWVLDGPPRPIHELRPDVPEELAAICDKAMDREPEQRYPDTGALAKDLRAYLENRVVSAHKRGAWIELRKWVQRNKGQAVAWAAALLVAVLGLGATSWVQAKGRRVAEVAERTARRERSNVLRLSAFQELEDLERDAEFLWPATLEIEDEMNSWIARAEKLIAGLDPDRDGEDPGHRRQLEQLRARATPMEPAEYESAAKNHPKGAELLRTEHELKWLQRVRAAREGGEPLPAAELDEATLPDGWQALNEMAWVLVDPERVEFGREAEGLALARLALERAPPQQAPVVLDTIAWGHFACGRDDEALEASNLALDEASSAGEATRFEEYLVSVTSAVQEVRDGGLDRRIDTVSERLSQLQGDVLGTTLPRFASEEDRWWHAQLERLIRRIEAFAHPTRGLLDGVSPEHGWGVRRRLEFARRLATLAPEGWDAVSAELGIPPQAGLVPLGPDPDSGLQEFADIATGTPPGRGPDGRLLLEPDSSVVFVLLPGGEVLLGAQPARPSEPNYDPRARPNEVPVNRVRLEPFFLSKYELTQGQWRALSGSSPSNYLDGMREAGNEISALSPVESISWLEARRFLTRLGWDLPTEAQWEYAARADTDTPWWTGEEPESLQYHANLADLFAHRHDPGYPEYDDFLDDGHTVHAPVGTYDPNPFGLHDMIGNVFELCRDRYADYSRPVEPGDGERNEDSAKSRILRGGSYYRTAASSRVSQRENVTEDLVSHEIGVRPMRRVQR